MDLRSASDQGRGRMCGLGSRPKTPPPGQKEQWESPSQGKRIPCRGRGLEGGGYPGGLHLTAQQPAVSAAGGHSPGRGACFTRVSVRTLFPLSPRRNKTLRSCFSTAPPRGLKGLSRTSCQHLERPSYVLIPLPPLHTHTPVLKSRFLGLGSSLENLPFVKLGQDPQKAVAFARTCVSSVPLRPG